MQKKQVFNPYLPLDECIPDGEPHVFGDRVYIYGSHDKLGGETFCMLDYTVYSAPVNDLSDWRCEGVIYRADQDPDYENRKYMYAPDVVRGNDGRYYLYYCMSGDFGVGGYFGPISVAVCDTPAGKYEYLGYVRHKDGTPMHDYVCFDPGVINDDGVIRVYYGTRYPFEEEEDFVHNEEHIKQEMEMFNKSREEILGQKDSVMGPCMVVLEDDMLTVKEAAKHIIPYAVKGTCFEEHPFFEASSIRKINDTYYFIYSSMQNHELCYATSKYPDRDFIFGGSIVSNGNVGINNRMLDDKLNMTGTTHGSIEFIDGQWYVFYHRLTHKSDYSRQACAEKITIETDGSIRQVEITSCGLSEKPICASSKIPAVVCCNLTNGDMPHGCNSIYETSFPNVNHRDDDMFIAEICDRTMIGYKYLTFNGESKLTITARSDSDGRFTIKAAKKNGLYTESDAAVEIGTVDVGQSDQWKEYEADVSSINGTYALYLFYSGEGLAELKELIFS